MEVFRITPEGRLVHETLEYEVVPKSERPYPNDDGILGLAGSMRSMPTGDVDANFHGALSFYDTIDGSWVEYAALFMDGNLIDLRRA